PRVASRRRRSRAALDEAAASQRARPRVLRSAREPAGARTADPAPTISGSVEPRRGRRAARRAPHHGDALARPDREDAVARDPSLADGAARARRVRGRSSRRRRAQPLRSEPARSTRCEERARMIRIGLLVCVLAGVAYADKPASLAHYDKGKQAYAA